MKAKYESKNFTVDEEINKKEKCMYESSKQVVMRGLVIGTWKDAVGPTSSTYT